MGLTSKSFLRDLGPCQVLWNSVDLGPTQGSVHFRFTEAVSDVKEDQKGVTIVDQITAGVSACEAEVPLTRFQIATMAAVMAGATGSGTDSNTIAVKIDVGSSQYDRAKELILKPIVGNLPGTDPNQWLHIPKAAPRVDADLEYGPDGQRVFKTMFQGYPDESGSNPAHLMWHTGTL